MKPHLPAFIYGLHESGGQDLMLQAGRQGWVLQLAEIGHEPGKAPSADYSDLANRGLGVVVRLNHGFGSTGTLPLPPSYDAFAATCAAFVGRTKGCQIWIVGNEPNHADERPDGQLITPQLYADCYRGCRNAIRQVPGHEDDLVLVAGPSPWNPTTTYPGNPSGDWVKYFADTLGLLAAGECDGCALHTYTHQLNVDQIRGEFFHGAPGYQHLHNEFKTYRDFMQAIPDRFRQLPVLITETDPTDAGSGWAGGLNIGWVAAAYDEIAAWNSNARNQPIQALILYRWPHVGDQPQWSIVDRSGIQDDFRAALRANPPDRYQARLPEGTPPKEPPTDLPDVPLPSVFSNQNVIDAFFFAARDLGLADPWSLLNKVAGLSLDNLVKDRRALYAGPSLAQPPELSERERRLVHNRLVEAVKRNPPAPHPQQALQAQPAPGVEALSEFEPIQAGFLRHRAELQDLRPDPPRALRIDPAAARDAAERGVARLWNRCGWALLRIADALRIDPGLAVAAAAAEPVLPGMNPDGRMRLRFENHIFFEKWGAGRPGVFAAHFQFDPNFPWHRHLWRSGPDAAWADPHCSQEEDWRAFECARSLDDTAAKLALAMGGAGIMGFSYPAIGHLSVDQMFLDFSASESNQVVGFFDLLAGPAGGSRELSALRHGDLDHFATLQRSPERVPRYVSELRAALAAFRRLGPEL